MASEISYSKIFGDLLKSWAINTGALMVLCVVGYWLHPVWLPLVAVVVLVLVQIYNNSKSRSETLYCPLFAVAINVSIVIAFVAMSFINLLNSRWLADTVYGMHFSYPQMPFITTLIVYPSMMLAFGFAIYIRNKAEMCVACRERAGYSIKDTIERNLFHQEVRFQIYLAFWISLCMSVVSWAYYFIFYINVNINTPDAFYFFALPAMIYGFSLLYLYMKYMSVNFEIHMLPGEADARFHTLEHFIVVRGDTMLLRELEVDGLPLGLWDSPTIYKRSYVPEISEEQAAEDFKRISGAADFNLRLLFSTTTEKQNCFHYAVFIDSKEELPKVDGKWCTLLDIDGLLKEGRITRPMAYELHRVYTMTMAWKTYDREGRRLYAIRNYRPTFKLSDFKNWDLDYSDLHWMSVAQNNEDKRFYRLRRLWRHYISGTEWLWKKKSS